MTYGQSASPSPLIFNHRCPALHKRCVKPKQTSVPVVCENQSQTSDTSSLSSQTPTVCTVLQITFDTWLAALNTSLQASAHSMRIINPNPDTTLLIIYKQYV
jgi:hypothetical protein